jgi:hypothetical protein
MMSIGRVWYSERTSWTTISSARKKDNSSIWINFDYIRLSFVGRNARISEHLGVRMLPADHTRPTYLSARRTAESRMLPRQ